MPATDNAWAIKTHCIRGHELSGSNLFFEIGGKRKCYRCIRARNRWYAMVGRCVNVNHPAYKDYGGRGIAVCDRWLNSFDDFYFDVGDAPEGMSLDRIDNDGDYEPGNVRWATKQDQALNRRPRSHCKNGHEYNEANTHIRKSGKRQCMVCDRERKKLKRKIRTDALAHQAQQEEE